MQCPDLLLLLVQLTEALQRTTAQPKPTAQLKPTAQQLVPLLLDLTDQPMEWDPSVDSVEEVVTTPLRLNPQDTLLNNLKPPLITLDSSSELQLELPFW